MHIRTHAATPIHTHSSSMCTHNISVQPYASVYAHVHQCTLIYTHVHSCILMYIYVQPCIYTHVHSCIPMYTNVATISLIPLAQIALADTIYIAGDQAMKCTSCTLVLEHSITTLELTFVLYHATYG